MEGTEVAISVEPEDVAGNRTDDIWVTFLDQTEEAEEDK